jgi:endonuclease/exonuclease/phosphatase family metal-dependent hydrolase
MGKGLVTNEDSREVRLRGSISSVRRRSYPALQELDSSPLLPDSDFRRDSKLPRRRDQFDDRLYGGLYGYGIRRSGQAVRSLGRVAERRQSLMSSKSYKNYKDYATTSTSKICCFSHVHTNSIINSI